ncbi:hypothetical protein [Bradyrhizobium sp. NBAIM08]|uniref:hypothetical protein n=1 Tax=Bradyrhizobium sp. NBAIM08 TaxID=2793815 RepID=UPI001CD5E06C|nr:hypothetical protein [Bradyrhizobium sp. NBAIM08]MCA1475721.1 hypothetical protein [Bradyrhizobium sp. NBAIM08]
MAVASSEIEAVRVKGDDGISAQYEWKPSTWYIVRDDCPYLDILVRGFHAQSTDKHTKLERLTDTAPEGRSWQRWSFEKEIGRNRRFGEVTLSLKIPEDTVLRCYVVPTLLLSYRDVFAMIEDIEFELGVTATWDVITERADRSWSRLGTSGGHIAASELVKFVDEELHFAHAIRRNPYSELGPRSRRNIPLPENAIVSHWAMRRHNQLQQSSDKVAKELQILTNRVARHNPEGRLPDLHREIHRIRILSDKIANLQRTLSRLCSEAELQTGIYPGPIFQRDYRLRHLLRAFAPRLSEALSPNESARSHYPPIYLNTLWELWGAVWLAKEFRRWGFVGSCFVNPVDMLHSCSWRLQLGDVVIELDYEAEPALIDYGGIPPVHDRRMPALEWAALNQEFDQKRPYFGSEEKCSPDYLIRITTPARRTLMVGDACLASPKHHGVPNRLDSKLYTVENYRRTVAWAAENEVVRCHPLGGFVLYPPPAEAWAYLQQLPGASDCTVLCPSPLGDEGASERLANLIIAIAPEATKHPQREHAAARANTPDDLR